MAKTMRQMMAEFGAWRANTPEGVQAALCSTQLLLEEVNGQTPREHITADDVATITLDGWLRGRNYTLPDETAPNIRNLYTLDVIVRFLLWFDDPQSIPIEEEAEATHPLDRKAALAYIFIRWLGAMDSKRVDA